MLRLLIGTGLLLMAVGFGAAGWQYWQSMPVAETVEMPETAPEAPVTRQSWLIAPSGGLVAQRDVRAYLVQERFVPDRTVEITLQARLEDLLVEDEKLPDATFLQVLADIRAPKVAEGLCDVLRQANAADCAVNSARVVEDSIDMAAGTARFRVELVYRMNDEGSELPDLAAHVFRTEVLRLAPEAGAQGTADARAALTVAMTAVSEACAAEGVGQICRPLRLGLDWTPGQPVVVGAEIGWLEPLPKGMFVAPPLEPAAGG